MTFWSRECETGMLQMQRTQLSCSYLLAHFVLSTQKSSRRHPTNPNVWQSVRSNEVHEMPEIIRQLPMLNYQHAERFTPLNALLR